jgi:hypothetical protein
MLNTKLARAFQTIPSASQISSGFTQQPLKLFSAIANTHQHVSRAFVISLALSLGACGVSDQPENVVTSVQEPAGDNGENNGASLEKADIEVAVPALRVSGHAASGQAIAGATVDLVWAEGSAPALATTDILGNFELVLPEGATFPVLVQMVSPDSDLELESLLLTPHAVNLNPLSTLLARTVTGGANGDSLDVAGLTTASYQAQANELVDALFGDNTDYASLDVENAELLDVLMLVIQGLNTELSLEEILASAIDTEDSRFQGRFLEDIDFQARLATTLIAQGYDAEEAADLLAQAGVSDDLQARANAMLTAFSSLRDDAEADGVSADLIEQLLGSSAALALDVLQGTQADDQDVATLLGHILDTVGPALAGVVADPAYSDLVESEQMAQLLDATSEEVGSMMSQLAGGSIREMSDDEFETMKAQLDDLAQLVGGPIASAMRNPLVDNLSQEQLALVMETMGDQLGDLVTAYINGDDADVDLEGLPLEAFIEADSVAGPLLETMLNMMSNEELAGADLSQAKTLLETMAEVVVDQLTQEGEEASSENTVAQELLNNLAGVVLEIGLNQDSDAEEDAAAVLDATINTAITALLGMQDEGSVDLNVENAPVENMIDAVQAIAQLVGDVADVADVAEVSGENDGEAAEDDGLLVLESNDGPLDISLVIDDSAVQEVLDQVEEVALDLAGDALNNLGNLAWQFLFGGNTEDSAEEA